jgi:excisionase family DNA binding protein
MVTQETLRLARTAAEESRQRGEYDRAKAIDALVEASRDEALPTLGVVTSSEAGDVLGVTGQTIKNWVRQGRLAGYRVGGRIMIPKEALADYVCRARGSLDLDDVSDEEAADLVAEGRKGARV